MIPYTIVGRLRQAAMFTFAELVVALSNLPNYSPLMLLSSNLSKRLTVRVYRDSLSPS